MRVALFTFLSERGTSLSATISESLTSFLGFSKLSLVSIFIIFPPYESPSFRAAFDDVFLEGFLNSFLVLILKGSTTDIRLFTNTYSSNSFRISPSSLSDRILRIFFVTNYFRYLADSLIEPLKICEAFCFNTSPFLLGPSLLFKLASWSLFSLKRFWIVLYTAPDSLRDEI